MCFGNQHTFTWGSSTAVEAMPLSLRCECGAIRRDDIAPPRQLQAENERLRAQLKIATEALGQIVHQGDGCEVAACAVPVWHVIAEDALIQMSVVE